MDAASAKRLDTVHPVLREKVAQLLKQLQNLGMDVRVVQGRRTFEEQDKLYNQPRDGRDNDGDGRVDERDEKVTNARGGASNHNYGLAVDLCPFHLAKPDWNDTRAFAAIGREAKSLGLEWGGDWKFKDMPHVQLKGMSIKECQTWYKSGGLLKVWSRMSELLGGAKPIDFIPAANEILEFGDKGIAILNLQKDLVTLGLLRDYERDGEFGKITKNAVIGFQRQNGLTADGIVGPGTKAKINAAIAAKTAFTNLTDKEIDSALVPATTGSTVIKAQVTEQLPQVAQNSDTIPAQNLESEPAPNAFEAKNLPAFIPRFGKQWLYALIPGGSFLTTIVAHVERFPQWLVFLLGLITGVAVYGFFQLAIAHRARVIEFITECYRTTADPAKHNLIPASAGKYDRNNELLSALGPKEN